MTPSGRSVDRYLTSVRRRATVVYLLRATAVAVGGGLLAFALLSTLVGPVVSLGGASAAWVAIAVVVGAGAGWALRGLGDLRGAGAARLIGGVRPELASAARSAVELAGDGEANRLASELVHAHASRVREALATVPVGEVVPWRRLRHPLVIAGAVAAALGGLAVGAIDRSASGAWALLHPSQEDEHGVRMAAVVSQLDARLVFPEYLGRAPVSLTEVRHVEAPRGTSVEVTVHPRITTTSGVLEVGDGRVRLSSAADGALVGRFVVREDAELRVRVRDESGGWLADPTRRTVHAVEDASPRVALLEPGGPAVVELREEVPIRWEARDDVGLRSVDLVVRTTDGREVRRRVADLTGKPSLEEAGATSVVAASFGARPGDDLVLWVEARDGDEVNGPNLGKSEERRLTIASDATRRAAELANLQAVLDAGLDALADRLEAAMPDDGAQARARYELLDDSARAFAAKLDDLADRSGHRPGGDDDVYREMGRRVRRELSRERRLYAGRVAPKARRLEADERLVVELENDSLLLADMLGRAQIEDAASITRELEDLRRQMRSLLEELRRADTPEARQALMAAIARAQARMRELGERLARMSQEVPQDFVNTDALPQAEAEDALAQLREAVERGDLDAAEAQLAALERQIDSIAKALGGGMEQFTEARFGPRERAMAEAMDALAGIEAEQQQLARRSSDVRRRAAERALGETGAGNEEAARRLMRDAERVRRSLEGLERGSSPLDQEAFDRAQQRMADVRDALRTGDLGEARRMAAEASQDVDDLARDLDLSALMFPGVEGGTADAARRAREAAEELRGLRRDIDRAIPQVGDFVDEGGTRQMREDARRQREVEKAAERLAERFQEGPDGTPLSPETAEGLREAGEAMERGRRSLDRRDPIDASRAQEEAARRITELREQLEREQQQRAEGGGGGGEGGEGAMDFREPVRIPGAEEFRGPQEMRRRLLDAMREGAPTGYEDAVRRYYEELLR